MKEDSNIKDIHGRLTPEVYFNQIDLSKVKNVVMAYIDEDDERSVIVYNYTESWSDRAIIEASIQESSIMDTVRRNFDELFELR